MLSDEDGLSHSEITMMLLKDFILVAFQDHACDHRSQNPAKQPFD